MSGVSELFEIKLSKFSKLVKEREIHFFGYGCLPTNKNGIDFEVWDLLLDLLDYEPFLEFMRIKILGDADE